MNSKVLNINKKGDVVYITFPSFEKYDFINHGFSTRIGGKSSGAYSSMNLGFNRGDNQNNVIENYKLFCGAMGVNWNDLVFSSQTHDTVIKEVNGNDRGKGIIKDKDYDCIDGLITNIPGVPLVTLYADCVPLFFVDPVIKAIGLAHAGWRGTVNKIASKMIDKFVELYKSKPKDIIVGIAPSIGQCCFEVQDDVYEVFSKMEPSMEEYIIKRNDGKYDINLWEINRNILIKRGIQSENITVADICTKCNSEVMWSHRVQGSARGSLAAIIALEQ